MRNYIYKCSLCVCGKTTFSSCVFRLDTVEFYAKNNLFLLWNKEERSGRTLDWPFMLCSLNLGWENFHYIKWKLRLCLQFLHFVLPCLETWPKHIHFINSEKWCQKKVGRLFSSFCGLLRIIYVLTLCTFWHFHPYQKFLSSLPPCRVSGASL